MFGIFILACGFLGLAMGSFLNVVIYRVPLHQSIVKPRSACPMCHAPILERDNIPVLSWLLLRRKCRNCRSPISARYPVVELTCAGLFAGVAAREGFNWEVPAMLILVAGLLALASIDLERLILPKSIVYTTLGMLIIALAVDSGVTHQWHRLLVAGLCAIVWFIIFFVLNFLGPRYLGFGDVRLSLLLGLGLGWLGIRYVILGFFAGNFLGAIIGLLLIATTKRTKDEPLPYGVYLALGAALALFVGPEILVHFQGLR